MEHLYIVLWRVNDTLRWDLQGIAGNPRDRDIIIAAGKIKNPTFQFAYVEGPITNPAEMAEQEAVLGAF